MRGMERSWGARVYADGEPVLGAMVNARLVDDRFHTVVNIQTDTFEAFNGEFMIPGLPPGEYEVWIEPVIPGSKVGSHESHVNYFPIRPEYYSGRTRGGRCVSR